MQSPARRANLPSEPAMSYRLTHEDFSKTLDAAAECLQAFERLAIAMAEIGERAEERTRQEILTAIDSAALRPAVSAQVYLVAARRFYEENAERLARQRDAVRRHRERKGEGAGVGLAPMSRRDAPSILPPIRPEDIEGEEPRPEPQTIAAQTLTPERGKSDLDL